MSTKYKATATEEAYFITITTVGWIDVFTRLNQKHISRFGKMATMQRLFIAIHLLGKKSTTFTAIL